MTLNGFFKRGKSKDTATADIIIVIFILILSIGRQDNTGTKCLLMCMWCYLNIHIQLGEFATSQSSGHQNKVFTGNIVIRNFFEGGGRERYN